MLLVALAVLAAVSTAAAIWFCFRRRSAPGKALDAVHHLLRTTPVLREPLSQQAAERLAGHLREQLACVAVGIADAEGSLLSWEGGARHHFADLADHVATVRRGRQRATVQHGDLPSSSCRSCGLGVAMIVPLIVDGGTEAVLVVVAKRESRQLSTMVDAWARIICIRCGPAREQFSPHFAYNALNTISALIRTEPAEARELLQEFADFIRYSFRSFGSFASLAEEMQNTSRYLAIVSAHYGSRLGHRMRIAPEVLGVAVPFLVLQPLVENAITHGLVRKPGGGTVTITAEDAGDEAVISVEDDGVGMAPEQLKALGDGSHSGLGNVDLRMRQIFGRAYALVVESAEGAGTKVTLRLPKSVPARANPEDPQ